jgi:hypothetical protein
MNFYGPPCLAWPELRVGVRDYNFELAT